MVGRAAYKSSPREAEGEAPDRIQWGEAARLNTHWGLTAGRARTNGAGAGRIEDGSPRGVPRNKARHALDENAGGSYGGDAVGGGLEPHQQRTTHTMRMVAPPKKGEGEWHRAAPEVPPGAVDRRWHGTLSPRGVRSQPRTRGTLSPTGHVNEGAGAYRPKPPTDNEPPVRRRLRRRAPRRAMEWDAFAGARIAQDDRVTVSAAGRAYGWSGNALETAAPPGEAEGANPRLGEEV